MAKIKGIEIKAMTKFKGHEGETLTQGNIYMDGKKIGWYSEDSWGGCMNIDIEKEYAKEFNKRAKKHADGEEYFLYDLINLKLVEDEFKKIIKKGYKALIVVKHERFYNSHIYSPDTDIEKTIAWLDKNGYEKYKIDGEYDLKVYKNLEDFNI